MFRFAPGWALMIAGPLFEEDGGGGGGGDDKTKDAAYWQNEAKRAFSARDAAKAEAKRLADEGLVMTPDQKERLTQLEKAAADAEEARKRKEGEFESWRKDITSKHQTELTKATERATALEREIASDKIAAAFGAATDYFGGGEKSKTILTPSIARNALGEFISYEEYDFGEDGGGKRKAIVVRDPKGKIIRGDDGHPAAFTDAIGKLLEAHPEKDHILRGSGKAGSGARGGGEGRRGDPIDYSNLTAEQMQDPKIRDEAKRRTASAGGIVHGEAWDRLPAAKR